MPKPEQEVSYKEGVEILEAVGKALNRNPEFRMEHLKGLEGAFYHGTDRQRRRDLKRICHRIIAEKLDAEVAEEARV